MDAFVKHRRVNLVADVGLLAARGKIARPVLPAVIAVSRWILTTECRLLEPFSPLERLQLTVCNQQETWSFLRPESSGR